MRRAALHLCEVHGDHYNEPAVGYFTCTTIFKAIVFLFACEECREWWLTRHPDGEWTELPPAPAPMVAAPRAPRAIRARAGAQVRDRTSR